MKAVVPVYICGADQKGAGAHNRGAEGPPHSLTAELAHTLLTCFDVYVPMESWLEQVIDIYIEDFLGNIFYFTSCSVLMCFMCD